MQNKLYFHNRFENNYLIFTWCSIEERNHLSIYIVIKSNKLYQKISYPELSVIYEFYNFKQDLKYLGRIIYQGSNIKLINLLL